MPAKFNFEEYLIGLGAIRSKELHAQGMGAMKVAEYEYKDFQFVIITNELGIKTQLVIMKNWNPLESRYCCYVPKTESFARELIEHITDYKNILDVPN